jgi:DNA-binding MarR family transcriptional regulator
MAASRLQAELKKRGPFASAQEEALLNLVRTADRIQIRFARLFRAHGLTNSQYNVLRILRGEGKPLKVLEIAARTVTVVPGITGLVDRLEQAGLVARRRCSDDRRVIFVELTPAGRALVARLDGPLADLHRQLLGHLSADELAQLSRLLEKARERCPGGAPGNFFSPDG